MAARQLNIRSDEAAGRAAGLAKRLGKTTTQVVEEALRVYEDSVCPRDELGFTPEERRKYEALTALSRRTARHVIPGSPADHDWLYDEHGLPK